MTDKKKNIFIRAIHHYQYMRAQWTDSVALGVLFATVISIVELVTPFTKRDISPTLFRFVPDWGIFCLGLMLIIFVIYSIKNPRLGGLAATFAVCGQLIISAIYPFSILGVIIWGSILVFSITSMLKWYRPIKANVAIENNE